MASWGAATQMGAGWGASSPAARWSRRLGAQDAAYYGSYLQNMMAHMPQQRTMVSSAGSSGPTAYGGPQKLREQHLNTLKEWYRRLTGDADRFTPDLPDIDKTKRSMTKKDAARLAEQLYGVVKQAADERTGLSTQLANLRAQGLGYMAPQLEAGWEQGKQAELGRGWREAKTTSDQQYREAEEKFQTRKLQREGEITRRAALTEMAKQAWLNAMTPWINAISQPYGTEMAYMQNMAGLGATLGMAGSQMDLAKQEMMNNLMMGLLQAGTIPSGRPYSATGSDLF